MDRLQTDCKIVKEENIERFIKKEGRTLNGIDNRLISEYNKSIKKERESGETQEVRNSRISRLQTAARLESGNGNG